MYIVTERTCEHVCIIIIWWEYLSIDLFKVMAAILDRGLQQQGADPDNTVYMLSVVLV